MTERIAKRGRYLGMEIDNELKIDTHCEKLLKRASKVASIIYYMRVFFNSSQLYQIYKTNIQTIYQNGVLIYGTANKSLLIKIEKQQKIIIRNSFKLKKYESLVKIKENSNSATLENYISTSWLSY